MPGGSPQEPGISGCLSIKIINPSLLFCFTRSYISTKNPSKALRELVSLLVNFYIPNYFNIKEHSHCQQGALNLFSMIELSRDLMPESRRTVECVLQDNSYWAHPEQILIAMLRDEREVIRRRAVLDIRCVS